MTIIHTILGCLQGIKYLEFNVNLSFDYNICLYYCKWNL